MKNFSLSAEELRRNPKTRKILYACVGIVIAILLGVFLFWLINGRTFKKKDAACSAVALNDRIDCHPDRPITKEECLKRGCCYDPASDLQVDDDDLIGSSYIGTPSCYFLNGFKGYSFGDIEHWVMEGITGITATLKRITPSGFKKDIQTVALTLQYVDDNTLRIQLVDANDKNRYKPDIPVYAKVRPTTNPLYDVLLEPTGLLTVSRQSTKAIVFKTQLSQLIYSDQFSQLTTSAASTYLYGFGEHKDKLLRSFNWTRLSLFNQGDLPVPHRNLYGTHPFYMVVEPDGNANGVFFRNTNAMDAILQPAPSVTLRTIGGILDFFIFLGPSPEDVVKQYTGIVGNSFMIPYWSLGFQICKYGYFTLNKTNEVLQRNLDAGVPIDVQWHDIDYMQRHLDFTYDPEAFAGLDKWVDDLHVKGMHYVAMISPGVSNTEEPGSYPAFDEAKKLDLFLKDVNGNYVESKVWNINYTVYPDFTNPSTYKYWADRFKEFHTKLDFDGVWLDMNEPLNFDNGSYKGCPQSDLDAPQYLPGRPYPLDTLTICMSSKHKYTTHYNEHNLLAFRESEATFKAMKDIRKKRPFIISRATFSGQGVYTGHWSGDITSNWEDLRYTIPSMLVFNMYGMPMIGSDICGFRTNSSAELCARWQSLGAFYPFSRNHNDFDTIEQDPAAFGGDVLEATKNALRTRYYLLPYFYYLFYRSHVFGETAVRPLFFEFPKDQTALKIDEQFLWGPAILISPVLYPGAKDVEAYFPSGVWYDFYNGDGFKSQGVYKTLSANMTFINVHVRGGYILPLQLPAMTTTASRENDFDVLVALDENYQASGEFYWDDGDSIDVYKNDKYNLNTFSATKGSFNNTVNKHNYPSKLNLNQIKIYGVSEKPSKVTINGQDTSTFAFSKTTLTITAKSHSLKENLIVTWQ